MGIIKQNCKKSVLWAAIAMAAILFLPITQRTLGRDVSSGKDVSSMYRTQDLSASQKNYESNIDWNFVRVIMPVLTKEERAALQNVQLEYPLVGRGGDPFSYYVQIEEKRKIIVIPMFSVKFLEDLSTAEAWLRHNKHSTETVPRYISMLKYQEAKRFQGGRYPNPLEALRIPPNEMKKNSAVDQHAKQLLKSTIVYLVSRELGILYYSRPYTTKKVSSEQIRDHRKKTNPSIQMGQRDLELKADAFAMEIMRRIGIPPDSLTFYLSAQVYWTQERDFSAFSTRLSQIARLMARGKEDYVRQRKVNRYSSERQIEEAATETYRLAGILKNKTEQDRIRQEALKLRINDLKPKPK